LKNSYFKLRKYFYKDVVFCYKYNHDHQEYIYKKNVRTKKVKSLNKKNRKEILLENKQKAKEEKIEFKKITI